MCLYVLLVPLCGHNPQLLFGPSCYSIYDQLNKITEPAAWEPPGLYGVPFQLPDSCLPNPNNIAVVQSTDFCEACQHAAFQHRMQQQQQQQQRYQQRRQRNEARGEDMLGYWPGVPRGVDPRMAGMYDPEPERIGIGWRP